MDTRTSPHRLRIERVQDALKARNLAALLVPSSDPHLSEYLPELWLSIATIMSRTDALRPSLRSGSTRW